MKRLLALAWIGLGLAGPLLFIIVVLAGLVLWLSGLNT